jgi:hypothetical protein
MDVSVSCPPPTVLRKKNVSRTSHSYLQYNCDNITPGYVIATETGDKWRKATRQKVALTENETPIDNDTLRQ